MSRDAMIEIKIYSCYMLSTCNFDFTFEKDYLILSNDDLTKDLFDPVVKATQVNIHCTIIIRFIQ